MRWLVAVIPALLLEACTVPGPKAAATSPLADIAYERDGKLPMVQVRINGRGPYWFVVDSGASRTVLDSRLAAEIGLRATRSGTTTGTGQGAVPLTFVGKVAVNLGGFDYASEPYVIDLSAAPLDKRVRGLVGSEVFKSHIVQLDPAQQRLRIFAPARLPRLGAAKSVALSVDGGKLFMPARLEARPGTVVERQLRIDTGSESSVNDPSAAEAEITASTRLGGGLGSDFEGVSGKFHSVQIGPYMLNGIWGPGGSPPAIGMELLQRFTLTFDAPHARLYLQPNKRLYEAAPHPPGEVRFGSR